MNIRSLLIATCAATILLFITISGLAAEDTLSPIRLSPDGQHFVQAATGERFFVWGVNYDHDSDGRLIEDYWDSEWSTIVEDFQEMKQLGANVIRVHLQLGRFMQDAETPRQASLDRLRELIQLAEKTGLYLDLTGLGCYHKQDVPAWYDAQDEAERWQTQARFWQAVAAVGRESPAIFCYDLMNEPVFAGEKGKRDWLAGEPLGGKYFVQRITLDARGRSNQTIAHAWVEQLTTAIHSVDKEHLITVGAIPWAQVFKGAKPVFYAPEVGELLDFVSIHLYPKAKSLDADLTALHVYQIGKPIVIEEIFPLSAGLDETETFIERARPEVDGFVSFYWGRTADDYRSAGGPYSDVIAPWLEAFQRLAPRANAAGK